MESKLDEMYDGIAKGAHIRSKSKSSKSKWIEVRENTKYFLE